MPFSNIKVAVFDFDDTLAIHLNRYYLDDRKNSEETWLNFYIKAYTNPDFFYDEVEVCLAPESLKLLVSELRNNGAKIYLLTGMPCSLNFEAKKAFVHKYYGNDIECLSVMDQKTKITAMKVLQRLHSCSPEQILLVDDIPSNIGLAKDAGFSAALTTDVLGSVGVYFLEFHNTRPIPSPSLIDEFEEKMFHSFSKDFKDVFIKSNGGEPAVNSFFTYDLRADKTTGRALKKNRVIKRLLSFNKDDTENIWDATKMLEEKHGAFIPFATDCNGNYIVLNASNSVLFYDSNRDDFEFVAYSFSDFLSGLY